MNDTFDNFTFTELYTTNLDIELNRNSQFDAAATSANSILFDDSVFFDNVQLPADIDSQSEDTANSTEQKFISDAPSQKYNESHSMDLSGDVSAQPEENCAVKCDFDSWSLPQAILNKYKSRQIVKMLPWQVECLQRNSVFNDSKSIVYSAPTSAGKTLVAEMLLLKTIVQHHKKVIFILPFVSVVREKMFYFQDILGDAGIRVEGFMGSYKPPGGFDAVQLAVCTIEKANSIVNKLMQESQLNQIGTIVIDEMHLLGDSHRGYLLELLLAKVKYANLTSECGIQIIGMSATLPNLPVLARWLEAELYVTDFRPVPLYEQVSVCGRIHDKQLNLVRQLRQMDELDTDTDHILQLCLETVLDSYSVVIFCPTKNWCENLAQQIAVAFWKLGSNSHDTAVKLRQQLQTHLIEELIDQLKYCPVGLDQVLRKTVSFGVAFHHAGLTMDERDIIERGFKSGTLKVLIATSTLSSGVNLPARRVIIRTPIFHGKPLDILSYQQMVGRAGRMGKDTIGESILICQENNYEAAKQLMTCQLQPIESCLDQDDRLNRAILEIVSSEVASSLEDIKLFTSCTLLAATKISVDELTNDAVQFLTDNEFVRLQLQDITSKYLPTPLAKACFYSSLTPEDGLRLYTELEKARQCFVLETELHLIYLVTPYSACYQWGDLDWILYLNLWEKLPRCMKRVGELVGVRESFIVKNTRGKFQTNNKLLLIHKRFFVALALHDLVNETELTDTAHKFKCNRGTLQSLQTTAATFAGMVTAFSKQLHWNCVEVLIGQFQDRLQFGVGRDLLDLMRLPILNAKIARVLFSNGFETLTDLAKSKVDAIENVLYKLTPFETRKADDNDGGDNDDIALDRERKSKMRNIWVVGKDGLTMRGTAELLLANARSYLQYEMGIKNVVWTQSTVETSTQLDSNISKISNADLNKTTKLDGSLFETSPELEEASNLSRSNLSRSNSDLNFSDDLIKTSQDDFIETNYTNRTPGKRPHSDHASQTPSKKIKSNRMGEAELPTKFEIVNVCKSDHLFRVFYDEIQQKQTVSLALAYRCLDGQQELDSIAVAWDSATVYYLNSANKALDVIKCLTLTNTATLRIIDAQKHIKYLKARANIDLQGPIEDPKIGDWILQPHDNEKNLKELIACYYPKSAPSLQCGVTSSADIGEIDIFDATNTKLACCFETFMAWNLMNSVKDLLTQQGSRLLTAFRTEMMCLQIISLMELNGIGVDRLVLNNMTDLLRRQMSLIENEAYRVAGRRFSLSSSKDVISVLKRLTGGRSSAKKRFLEQSDHIICKMILEWRKFYFTEKKLILPLIRAIKDGRIYSSSIFHTTTGRISMHEPNLQNVPKPIDIVNSTTKESMALNCRRSFVPAVNNAFVSADFCQIELRLLAHFSQDRTLCSVFKHEGDVFKSIAAKWNNLKESKVSDELRQRTKGLCYGIIYGMGNKSLAAHMNIDEMDANELVESFHNTYPGIRRFIRQTVENCQRNKFVETIAGRRRYLPRINDQHVPYRSQAERQALNSTIQGSAADLMKKTIVNVSERFSRYEPSPQLVLHLHDEIIYEVPIKCVRDVALILKTTMEDSVKLSIPFPVKIKTGPSWGQLSELVL